MNTPTRRWPQASPQEIHRLKAVLEYLEGIPAEHWCRGYCHSLLQGTEQWCALGHLDRRESPVYWSTLDFGNWCKAHGVCIPEVNDRPSSRGPREAVLRALRRVLRRIGGGP